MTATDTITFPCLEIEQPIGRFYLGTIDASDLVYVSYADVQRIERRDVEEFLGIERPLSKERVRDLQKYVQTVDATFPTSIIVSVSSDDTEYNPRSKVMTLTRAEGVAKIIDGQHRIAGLTEYENGRFQVNVVLFVDIDLEDQAMIFATINLKQTKVSKSLAFNLYEYATTRSPRKTAHDIAKLLNRRDGSPFLDKIKILGRATPGKEGETLTQAAFVDSVTDLISDDPDTDWDWIKRGRPLKRAGPSEARRLIFRNMFIDERDARIARALWNYFSAVAERWPEAWKLPKQGRILNRTTGFAALMAALPRVYNAVAQPGELPSVADCAELFHKVKLTDEAFTSENFKPGSSGQAALARSLLDEMGLLD